MIHLDTSIAIALIGEHPAALRHFAECAAAGEAMVVSSIVYFELCFGVAKSRRREHNQRRLDQLLSGPLDIAPFTERAGLAAGEIRATLEKGGFPIGPFDVLIAGHALAEGPTRATDDVGEFARVPGLRVANGTRDPS
ncbi:PIN domain-containing protein [Nostoc sp. NIES-2111]